ncbi:DUF4037 domain-containing protein [Peptacetobacter sp. AB845]|uniref:DUF4037 domain-containing protein n=1 Tax=Peptacetobacter sp. AB845 TaxID=3388429 RepID=UPI0039C9B9F2
MKTIDEIMKEVHSLWRQGREKEMAPLLEEAINLCKLQNNNLKLIELLNEYGGCLRNLGEFDKAISAIKESIEVYEKSNLSNEIAYATSIMNLANIYREKKDYFNAEKYFNISKSIFDKLGDKSYSYVGLLNNFSLLYKEIGDYSSAEKMQLESIRILEKNSKMNVPLAISYNNLYEIQKLAKSNNSSIENLRKAEQILLKETGTNHPLYASVLNNMADYEFSNKNYNEALSLYKKALEIVRTCYGEKSEAFLSVSKNIDFVDDFIKTLSIKEPSCSDLENNFETKKSDYITSNGIDYIKSEEIDYKNSNSKRLTGLERAEIVTKYTSEFIKVKYPDLYSRICLALVGVGSECLGFDDEISEDHDFSSRCQLFLDDSDYKTYKSDLESSLKIFCKDLESLTSNLKDVNIEIMPISNFYKYYTLFENGPKTESEYRKVPMDLLCVATNGKVFLDNLGKFSEIRNRLLNFYPEDIRLKKIAFQLNKMAQSGQYNYSRMIKRGDTVAANIAQGEFVKHYLEFVHLLNKKYIPFYKWSYRSACSLEILGNFTKDNLKKLSEASIYEKESIIEEICLTVVNTLNELGLSHSKIDFLTYQAEEVRKNILNPSLRNEDSWIE